MTRAALSCLLVLGSAGALAQVADPTLPPASVRAPAASAAPAPAPARPQLQSILLSREAGGRRVAVISGEMVRQGSRFQGAVVERVDAEEVVLRRGKAREVLRLYPARGAPVAATAADSAAAKQQARQAEQQ